MRIGELGSIVYDRKRVIAQVGNFSIEDANAMMCIDAGAFTHTSWTIPHPEYVKHMHVQAADTAASRSLTLALINEAEHIDTFIAQLIEKNKGLVMEMPVIRSIPMLDSVVFQTDVRDNQAVDNILEHPENGVHYWQFMDMEQVLYDEAMQQVLNGALAVLQRFLNPDKPLEARFATPWGLVETEPAPERLNSRSSLALAQLIAKLESSFMGKSISERITSKEAQLLFALKRCAFYGDSMAELFVSARDTKAFRLAAENMFDAEIHAQAVSWGAFLYKIKLFLEAILDAAPILREIYTFQSMTGVVTREFDILMHNMHAAEAIYPVFEPYFRSMPLAMRYRWEGKQHRYVMAGSMLYHRQMYNLPNDSPTLNLGGFSAFTFMPSGAIHSPVHVPELAYGPSSDEGSDRWNKKLGALATYYRSNRDITRLVLGVSIPFWPGEGISTELTDLTTVITDRLSDRVYHHPWAPERERSVPLASRVMASGGTIDAEQLVPGYTFAIRSDDNLQVNGSVCLPWTKDSPFRVGMSYSVPTVPYATAAPFAVR